MPRGVYKRSKKLIAKANEMKAQRDAEKKPLVDDPEVADRVAEVEKVELIERSMNGPEIVAMQDVFGPKAPRPKVFIGPDNCFVTDDDGTNPRIIMQIDRGNLTFLHEYAHFYAFWACRDLALAASREKHERWADLVVNLYKGNQFAPYPEKFCTAFFAKED